MIQKKKSSKGLIKFTKNKKVKNMGKITERRDLSNVSFQVIFELRNIKRLTKDGTRFYTYMGELWTTKNPANQPKLLMKRFKFTCKDLESLKQSIYFFNVRDKIKTY